MSIFNRNIYTTARNNCTTASYNCTIPSMYLVFISIISQQHLILVTCPIAPAYRNSPSLVNFMTKMVNLHFSILIVAIYMGISLVKFVRHIFWIHYQHSHKSTSFHKQTLPKRPLYQMVFYGRPHSPLILLVKACVAIYKL